MENNLKDRDVVWDELIKSWKTGAVAYDLHWKKKRFTVSICAINIRQNVQVKQAFLNTLQLGESFWSSGLLMCSCFAVVFVVNKALLRSVYIQWVHNHLF